MVEPVPTEAFIAVGSNIDPAENIPRAMDHLLRALTVTGVSTFYWTEPLDRPDQGRFANGIIRVETDSTPRELKFDVLRPVEAALGRVRTDDAYAARTIDLDVALFGDQVSHETDLILPDPDILERPFLAAPLLELAPGLTLPGSSAPLAEQPVAVTTDDMERAVELTEQLRGRAGL